ncbi:MAG: MscS mechanosensitive ion channel [Candidatus Peregrinibacteria bacterium Gr01-1014_25]|nr:MAG: MscS mechanosensitive ion channel [Candidatus Peregrinibacteria bacterium Gr01-1014_25]
MRRILASIVLCIALFPAGRAAAQTAERPISIARLQQLYTEQLAHPSASIEQRIAKERARVRTLIDDELNVFINESLRSGGDPADVAQAITRQRTLVDALESQLNEAKVDLSLLREEEDVYTRGGVPAQRDTVLTGSHQELLARSAFLEERVASLEFFLIPQRERLQKLEAQERWTQFSLTFSLLTIALVIIAVIALERFIRARVLIRIPDASRRYTVRKVTGGVIYAVLVLWVLHQLSDDFPGIVTSFAIIGAGLAVALQDVVKDIVGWSLVVQGRHCKIGDRVAVGPWSGDIVDIGLLRTVLLDAQGQPPVPGGSIEVARVGKTLSVPNALFLTQPLLNYSAVSDFVRMEIVLTVPYDSDWRKAESLLRKILEERTAATSEMARHQQRVRLRHLYISEDLPGPMVYVDLTPAGVQFSLRSFVPLRERRVVISAINREILEAFGTSTPPIPIAVPVSRMAEPPEQRFGKRD